MGVKDVLYVCTLMLGGVVHGYQLGFPNPYVASLHGAGIDARATLDRLTRSITSGAAMIA
jgi:hypothetical protein